MILRHPAVPSGTGALRLGVPYAETTTIPCWKRRTHMQLVPLQAAAYGAASIGVPSRMSVSAAESPVRLQSVVPQPTPQKS